MNDKQLERRRYELRASATLERGISEASPSGSAAIAPVLRRPYLAYEAAIRSVLEVRDRVLEIGAGTGLHTRVLADGAAQVVATDIAFHALAVLTRGWRSQARPKPSACACDMERLPFRDGSFDFVACAGSLSYGDPRAVTGEIVRVIRVGGSFVCVDSLDHNPLYRLNRWIQFKRGRRSASTIRHMPDMARIRSFSQFFADVDVQYFGGFTWAMPAIVGLVGSTRAAALSDWLDRLFRVRRSAFKFVLVARGRR